MVCTSVPLATQIGLDILKRGGSAVDAAIAANAALGLMEPVSNGIGGDLFAIVYSAKENKLYGLNGSGRSPLGLSYDQMKAELAKLKRETIPPHGHAADQRARVRGRLGRAAQKIRQTHAELTICSGAIRYAEEGFPGHRTDRLLLAVRTPSFTARLPGAFLETYTLDGKGRTPAKGDIFKNPALAKTLRLIGEKGRDAFYKGEIADKIDAFMQANGGYLRKADFEKHTSTWVEPVSVNYRGYDVFELPPNGQGIAALQMLNILEGFDLRAMGFNSRRGAARHDRGQKTRLGRSREILRRSGVLENSAGRVALETVRGRAPQADRSGTRRAKSRAGKSARSRTATRFTSARPTTRATWSASSRAIIAGWAAASSCPASASCSRIAASYFPWSRATRMFTRRASVRFTRSFPGFVMKDRKPWLAFGVMGGGMQPQGHVQVLTNMIDFGMDVQEAGDASRWQHEGDSEPTGEKMTETAVT